MRNLITYRFSFLLMVICLMSLLPLFGNGPDSLVSMDSAPVAVEDSISPEETVAASDSSLVEGFLTAEELHLGKYARWVLANFQKSPLLITILYIVIIYSILTLITLLIIILLNRRRMEREKKNRDSLMEQYQQLLMDYLFEEEKKDQAFANLKRIANNSINRQILIDQMIDLSINLKGDIKEHIKELYLRMGLKKDSLKKAYSKKWHKNVKGIRELAFMNIRDANEKIIESLNSNNDILRMEAQIAMVRLSEDNPYEFLHLLEKPLSVWEQITLHELLTQHNMKVPAFKQWFESENISILIYALEMVAWFKQKGVAKEVISLFTHEDEQVRHTAFRVCGEIRLKSSLPAMKKIYAGETLENRLEILKAFARIPEENSLKFLKNVLDTEEDVQLQIQATKAIENTDEPGISMLIKLMKSKSEYKNYQIIIRHVLDGRIY